MTRVVGLAAAFATAVACGARTSIDDLSTEPVGPPPEGGASRTATPDAGSGRPSNEGGAAGNARGEGGVDDAAELDFRASEAPFCASADGRSTLSVWSDSRGVFVLEDVELSGLAFRTQISFNGGTGWSRLVAPTETLGPQRLSGFAGGPLLEYGRGDCGVVVVRDGVVSCSAGVSAIEGVSVVSGSRAFAIEPPNLLLAYDGTSWTQLGNPLPIGSSFARAVWASAQTVLVAADGAQLVVYGPDGKPQAQAGLPAGDYQAAWGFGPNDLWVGSAAGELVHGDGAGWRQEWTTPESCGGILGMWGDSSTLYFFTRDSVLRWRGGGVESLLSFPCDGATVVSSLWGRSASEVFVTVEDQTSSVPGCGAARVFWFDGSAFRQL